MIRGLSFRISQKIDVPLFNIFTGINIEDYYWFCVPDQEEVWNEKGCMPFFEKTTYTGKEFSDLIKQECYVIFLKLQAYPSKTNYYNIRSYNEFEESGCQLLLLIYDCEFVEIYCKNENDSKTIYNNAIDKKFDDLQFITDSNDNRYSFNIL